MRAFFLLVLLPLLAACAHFSEPSGEAVRTAMGINVTPEQMGDTPPQVSYSAEVIMARAEGYFRQRMFPEAVTEYGRFIELHGTHPWASYALFRRGMSYIHQIQTPDRDPSFADKARADFENLIANYPASPAVPYAREQLAWAINQQALHELGIAQFYLRTDHAEAARDRLNDLLTTYPEAEAALEARYELGRAYEALNDKEKARDAYAALLDTPAGDGLKNKARRALRRLTGD